MLAHERVECARVVGCVGGVHVVVLGLAGSADDLLQVLGQGLELLLAHDQLGSLGRLGEAGDVVVLGDLVEAQRQVVVGTDELGSVQRAGLHGLEDVAGGQVHHRHAHLLPDLATQAGRTHAQALHVGHGLEFLAEPAAGLNAGVAGQEALHAELVIDLVPQRLGAHDVDPGRHLGGRHAVGHAGEEGQGRALVHPVIGGAVAHLGRAFDDGIQRLQGRHHLAGSIDLDRELATGHLGDAPGQALGAGPDAGEVLGPAGDHPPLLAALRDGGGSQGGTAGSDAGGDAGLQGGATIHYVRVLVL